MTPLTFGTPGNPDATTILLLGSGELGREVAIEAMRLGVEVHAADAYPAAPAMQIAHHAHVIDMQDGHALRELVEEIRPDFIVPEVEAIATGTLLALEDEGHVVIPTARATKLTMDREHIRRLVAEELGLPTSPYAFADSEESFQAAVDQVGVPCVVKPVMSSSGKGQSLVKERAKAKEAWDYALAGSRGRSTRVIVEGFVDFDTEITLLTVRHQGGTSFCPPIGHRQERGDYMESWQPQALPDGVLEQCQAMAKAVTDALATTGPQDSGDVEGYGLFGVELFIAGDEVIFSELSPRPHDTGMVTMVTQDLSEFALHVRAILGIPIPETIELVTPGASAVILADGEGSMPHYTIDPAPLRVPGTDLRLFAKPTTRPYRRMGVGLARGENVEEARARATAVADGVRVDYET